MTDEKKQTEKVEKIVADAAAAVKNEMYKRFAIGIVAGALGLLFLAGLGAWAVLLPALKREIGGVPSGAVVALDDSNGCPAGWVAFEQGKSRFIVGASDTHASTVPNNDASGVALESRTFRENGGFELVTLSVDQLPTHDHPVTERDGYARHPSNNDKSQRVIDERNRTDTAIGRVALAGYRASLDKPENKTLQLTLDASGKSARRNIERGTGPVGKEEAHDNMPPYIALFYCKKN